ncbi:TadE/TadG family type IV pilus assembly protein [Jatrophihabitans sp.]|uniref:TadE/TadG family type IV pilus assembly protein n=1 Tax=Jatrophihabitans sp. TaxID=1932789 RepID=UPI0038CD37D2
MIGGVCRDRDSGFSTVEAVIVIPLVVSLTMIVVQYVMLYHARNVTEAAARDGLRVARGYQASAAQGKTAAEQYLTDVAPKLLAARNCDAQRSAVTVVMVCHAEVASVVPFGSFSVTEQATGPVETFGTGR